MRTIHASLEYILRTTDEGLESFELARLGRSANLRKELVQVVTEMVGSEVEGRLAGWLLGRRRPASARPQGASDLAQQIRESNSLPPALPRLSGSESRAIALLPEPATICEDARPVAAILPPKAAPCQERSLPATQLELVFLPTAERAPVAPALLAGLPCPGEAPMAAERESARVLRCLQITPAAIIADIPRPFPAALMRLNRLSRHSLAASPQPPRMARNGGSQVIRVAARATRSSNLQTVSRLRKKHLVSQSRCAAAFRGPWQFVGLPVSAVASGRNTLVAPAQRFAGAPRRARGRSKLIPPMTRTLSRRERDAASFAAYLVHICPSPCLRPSTKQTPSLARASPDEWSVSPRFAFLEGCDPWRGCSRRIV